MPRTVGTILPSGNSLCLASSEQNLCGKLEIARVVGLRQADLAGCGGVQAGARRAQLRGVQPVECFGAELQADSLVKGESLNIA